MNIYRVNDTRGNNIRIQITKFKYKIYTSIKYNVSFDTRKYKIYFCISLLNQYKKILNIPIILV